MDNCSYLIHGLMVRAPFPLSAVKIDCPEGEQPLVDLVFVEGAVPTPPDGIERILEYEVGAERVDAHRDQSGLVWVEFVGVARFLFDGGTVRFELIGDSGLAHILCEGWIMAMFLFFADHAVLHASAVVTSGGTYAFVGNSGSGKSTLAALLCGEGALLVADDVTRIDVENGAAVARRGATALRLRPAAFGVADRASGDRAETVDGRLAFAPAWSDHDRNKLDAVLLPLPDRSTDRVEITWLSRSEATWELLSRPRIYRFLGADERKRELAHAARVAGSSRIGFLRLPWGPPWPTDLSDRIADAMVAEGGSDGSDPRHRMYQR